MIDKFLFRAYLDEFKCNRETERLAVNQFAHTDENAIYKLFKEIIAVTRGDYGSIRGDRTVR